jgi:hypothetical protein
MPDPDACEVSSIAITSFYPNRQNLNAQAGSIAQHDWRTTN